MTVKDRYSGIQTTLGLCHTDGCHFLTLLSIAEEESGKYVDLIDAIRVSTSKKWMDSEFTVTVQGSLDLLKHYTGKKWTRREVTKLPAIIKDNEYTEAIYYNPDTKYHHYRRRGYDTIVDSATVRNGHIEKYYIYTCEG